MSDTWIMGLNHGPHDAACALFRNGQLEVVVEQERVSRTKRAVGESPALATAKALTEAGVSLSDMTAVALGSNHDDLAKWMGYKTAKQRQAQLPYDQASRLFPPSIFANVTLPPISNVRHHTAHAASAFWPSGFERAAVLIIDAMGEDTSTSLGIASRANGVLLTETYEVGVSLGFFFEAACQYAGLGKDNAGKLMGLAAYGTANQDVGLTYEREQILWTGITSLLPTGRAYIDDRINQLIERFERTCYPYTIGLQEEPIAYANFAASVQLAAEQVIVQLALRSCEAADSSDLVVAGGVGLNCGANRRLASQSGIDRLWIQPMASDAGVALGAGAELSRVHHQPAMEPMHSAAYGPMASDAEVEAALDDHGLDFRRVSTAELAKFVAEAIRSGKIVVWHQGKAEVGPRSLGGRSFLGDPTQRQSLVRLNEMKGREVWRPLAPSVLISRFADFFTGTPNPFMVVAATVRQEVQSLIPAVVHVDGSARPQVVDEKYHPELGLVLRTLDHACGIPMVINTSLNIAGEPICQSAHDSVNTYVRSHADVLAIGRYIVARDERAHE